MIFKLHFVNSVIEYDCYDERIFLLISSKFGRSLEHYYILLQMSFTVENHFSTFNYLQCL